MDVHTEISSVQDFQHEPFDVIVCNPPYFKGDLVNKNSLLKNQRHQLSLSLCELMLHVKRLLKSNGRFYLVHRASYLNDICTELVKHKMRIKTLQFLYDDHKDRAISVLMEIVFSETIEINVLKPIYNKR